MSDIEYSDLDIQLELKDRLDYSYVIQATLINLKKAMYNVNTNPAHIENLLWDFITDIPTAWFDKQFLEDTEKAFIDKEIDVRPIWGTTRISIDICKERGYPTFKTVKILQPFILKNAIINLLHRRDMLVRKKKIEYSTGKNLKYQTLDELPDAKEDYENQDMLEMSEGDKQIKAEIDEIEKGELE